MTDKEIQQYERELHREAKAFVKMAIAVFTLVKVQPISTDDLWVKVEKHGSTKRRLRALLAKAKKRRAFEYHNDMWTRGFSKRHEYIDI